MITIAVKTGRDASQQIADACDARQPWKNNGGSMRGEPLSPHSSPSYGIMPSDEADALRALVRTGDLDYVIYSYATPIAWHANGEWTFSSTRYSPTTSQHQGRLYRVGK
jgi:hypothetical protein